VRALFPKASANLNIRWNDHTYVFELTESGQPVLSLNMQPCRRPDEEGVGPCARVSPIKLLALLDKAKAFRCSQAQQPESVPTWTSPPRRQPLVSDFNDYESRSKKPSDSTPRTHWFFASSYQQD